MADRYDDRYRGEEYRRERVYGRESSRDDRGLFERAGDEVRSWFGDEEAERRRRLDEARYRRDWDRYGRRDFPREEPYDDRYGREWDYGHPMGLDYGRPIRERGWSGERWGGGERMTGDVARVDYWRPGWPAYWNEGSYGERFDRGRNAGVGRYGAGYTHGPFAGRGPRGYQRSDERIREDVCDRLSDDPWIDASDVEVTVRAGEVTLTGSVRDRSDKRWIEDAIEGVSGVREVHNNLRVSSGYEGSSREHATSATSGTMATTPGSRR